MNFLMDGAGDFLITVALTFDLGVTNQSNALFGFVD
jgi:hypothetical protein